jgi:hypothetical protein
LGGAFYTDGKINTPNLTLSNNIALTGGALYLSSSGAAIIQDSINIFFPLLIILLFRLYFHVFFMANMHHH